MISDGSGAAMITLAGITGALWIVDGCYLAAVLLPGLRPEWSLMRRAAPPPALDPAPP